MNGCDLYEAWAATVFGVPPLPPWRELSAHTKTAWDSKAEDVNDLGRRLQR